MKPFSWFKKSNVPQNKTAAAGAADKQEASPKAAARFPTDLPAARESDAAWPEAQAPVHSPSHEDGTAANPQSDPNAAGTAAQAGFFRRLKSGLAKTRQTFSSGIERLFAGRKTIDADLLEELEELLIAADIGVQTAANLIGRMAGASAGMTAAAELKIFLRNEIRAILQKEPLPAVWPADGPRIIMVVGVNGVGKTTTIGKLAAKHAAAGRKVLVAAADTFRAAAIEQLAIWTQRAGAELVKHKEGADPAAVAYDALEAAQARGMDILLIDTAGRLHTRVNLMEELKKMKRIISKKIAGAPHEILLVLDATTGQNALAQARMFHDTLHITGLAVTKLDGTAKGGIVVSICDALNIPLKYVGVGETVEDLQDFDPEQFVSALF